MALQKCVQRSGNLLKKSDHKHQFEEGLQPTLKQFVLEKEPQTLANSFQEAHKQKALLLRLKINNPAINSIVHLPTAAIINSPPPSPPSTNNFQQQLQQMQNKMQTMQTKISSKQKQIQQYQKQQTQRPKYNSNRNQNQHYQQTNKPF